MISAKVLYNILIFNNDPKTAFAADGGAEEERKGRCKVAIHKYFNNQYT